jgi:type I restriction-modification system DNA methylase subunit
MAEGQKGGEFYTPASLVKLIVEVIEPYHGQPSSSKEDLFTSQSER